MPHALIAAYGGNTVLAASKFAEHADPDANVVVLVDFENDSVRTALEVARALGPRLWGVRLDTSWTLVDRSLWARWATSTRAASTRGWSRRCARRSTREGFERVKIVVSGGFDVEKITDFERAAASRSTPTASAPRSSAGENDFTADVVLTDGRPSAKVGPALHPEPAPRARRVTAL